MILNLILQGPIRMLLPPYVNYVVDQAGEGLLGKLRHKDDADRARISCGLVKFPRSKNLNTAWPTSKLQIKEFTGGLQIVTLRDRLFLIKNYF